MLKNRVARVQFKTPGGDKELDGIEVKFSIEKNGGAIMNKGTIDICNLARADIEYLTTYTSQFIAINDRKRIRLIAGYDDEYGLLFDGDIINALPTMPPDIWLHCQALSGYYNNKDNISYAFNETKTVKELIEDAAGRLDLPLVWNAENKGDKKIVNYEYTGTKTAELFELNKLDELELFEDDGELIITDKGKPREILEVKQFDAGSGLVGIPSVDPLGVTIKILLDYTVKIKQVFNLESDAIPSASGKYYIYNIKHYGDLRGNDFYTEIKGRRF